MIMKRVGSLLLDRDMLGHDLSVNYRGNAKFNTYVGSIISLGIYAMVLVQLLQKVTDLVQMRDPQISVLTRPLYEEEVIEFGEINLHDFRFDFGVFFRPGKAVNDYPQEYVSIPPNIGRILFTTRQEGDLELVVSEAVNCTNLFPHVNIELTQLA